MRDCAESRNYLTKLAVAKCAVMHCRASNGINFRHKKDKGGYKRDCPGKLSPWITSVFVPICPISLFRKRKVKNKDENPMFLSFRFSFVFNDFS
jgi:hypothetical protein